VGEVDLFWVVVSLFLRCVCLLFAVDNKLFSFVYAVLFLCRLGYGGSSESRGGQAGGRSRSHPRPALHRGGQEGRYVEEILFTILYIMI
jgi:hypothetical protein